MDRLVPSAVLLVLVRYLLSCGALRAELEAKNRQLQQMELKVDEYKDSLLKVISCACVVASRYPA